MEPIVRDTHSRNDDMVQFLAESDLQRQLLRLGPGERVDFDIGMNGELPPNRFWRVSARGEIDISLMTYLNSPVVEAPRPHQPHWPTLKSISIHDVPPSIFRYSGTIQQLGHMYNYSWCALVSQEILDCMLQYDPGAFEYRAASVDGLPVERAYYLTLITRALDPTDPSRMRGWIQNKPIYSGASTYARTAFLAEYSIRSDIPQTVHMFASVFGDYPFWSSEMLTCIRSKGVTGLEAHRTEMRARGHVQYF
jgi:hypothetical protein